MVYDALRRLAAAKMAGERPGQTLQATALVHEAWLRLAGGSAREWNDRQQFFRAAAEAMRRVLVDRARARRSQKRGADLRSTDFSEFKAAASAEDRDEVLEVNEALEGLARRDPISADLVKLGYGEARHGDRALQAASADWRRRHGDGLYGRARNPCPPAIRAQNHQAWHGHSPSGCPI